MNHPDLQQLRLWLNQRSSELGFSQLRVTDTDLSEAIPRLKQWLEKGHHGQMDYMSRHASLREDPALLQPGAIRTISVNMPYINAPINGEMEKLADPEQAVISIYARGRDYHKVMRSRLQQLSTEMAERIGEFGYRVFTDSAPLMEVELARKAGLGWRGKHTLLLNREEGSLFFLGEILVDVPLLVDQPIDSHCGSCQACIDICPTRAITAPYELDARKCISYLTIEHRDAIPLELRPLMGNRVYGCDDCQLVCPWNKFAKQSTLPDFVERHGLGSATLLELWSWSEAEFNERHEGSPIRRIGYSRWRRNLAVALGNALSNPSSADDLRNLIRHTLQESLQNADTLAAEHIDWALHQTGSQTPVRPI